MLDIEKWTPLLTFTVAYGCGLVGSIGQMVKTAGEGGRPVTWWRLVECLTYWGPLSIALPMLVWKSPILGQQPLLALAVSFLVGLGIIKVTDYLRLVRGRLGLEEPHDVRSPVNGPTPTTEADHG